MSLYYEAAEVLTAPSSAGGSLKSRIFSKKDLKSTAAQIYALAIETCKWSRILTEIIENADILRLERKLTPILSLLLVHDLLLAKGGVALPATHGLRTAVERHKGRLQAELTKARIRRKLSSVESLKEYVESGQESSADVSEAPYPRWVRINTLKTTLEDQLDTTFAGYERATTIDAVRKQGSKRLYIDGNIPNLIAITPNVDISKTEAYSSGCIIFQDKASCFPAYLLDPLPEDGDFVDTCSAPGNKTTHIAAILLSHNSEPDECKQTIFAFEKNKGRAETLEKMVNRAGSEVWTKLHAGQDFLKTDPDASVYKSVGALLLDPSCSGSGIVGRDEMPELHLPAVKQDPSRSKKGAQKASKESMKAQESKKRKREEQEELLDVMVDDDGVVTAVNNDDELKARLEALSAFQLELLLHALKFPAARKITYSTCSIHAEENELVVQKALNSKIAKERGWRTMTRAEQIRGMRDWPVRGSQEACGGDEALAESCIRANKGDEHGTMGFFLAGLVRDQAPTANIDAEYIRDERGHLVRDLLGFPMKVQPTDLSNDLEAGTEATGMTEPGHEEAGEEEEEWTGFGDNDEMTIVTSHGQDNAIAAREKSKPTPTAHSMRNSLIAGRKGLEQSAKGKKRRKGKKTS